MIKTSLLLFLLSSAIYCEAQKFSSDTIYLPDGPKALKRTHDTNRLNKKQYADSIAFKKQWLIDSVRLVNHVADSSTYTKRAIRFGNSFADLLGVSKSQRDSLIQADLLIEGIKMNARYIPDRAARIAELQLAERQRDVVYKEILTDEQYKKFLQLKRQHMNAAYIQEVKANKIKK